MTQNNGPNSLEYVPPRVEFVLTPDELEREVLYAGANGTAIVG